MRALILLLVLLPAVAFALPVNKDVHYFAFTQCGQVDTVLIVTHNWFLPVYDVP